jgi:predicted LPLAT superfamily acyltransferase
VTLPRASRDAALTALATTYAAWLEALLVRSPFDWFNFYDFWADDPVRTGRQNAQDARQDAH